MRLWQRRTTPVALPFAVIPASSRSLSPGHLVGQADAPLVVHVYSDYQCPHCRTLWHRSRKLLDERPSDVSFAIHALPASGDPAAVAAAIAAECAAKYGLFADAHSFLLEHQDSLRTAGLAGLAGALAVPDSAAFAMCQASPQTAALVNADRAVGESLGVAATPIIIIGRDVYRGVPHGLEKLIDSALSIR